MIDRNSDTIVKFFSQSGKVDKASLERGTKILRDFSDFLNCNPHMMVMCCQNLKEQFQDALKLKMLTDIIEKRKDITESEKKEACLSIKEVLKQPPLWSSY